MILTEDDYEKIDKYRQALFSLLQSTLLTGDVLIIGQSLRDCHLLDLVRKVLASKLEGSPGTIYVLVYDKDDLRAPLLEDRGARVAFGGIDEFVHTMADGFQPPSDASPPERSDLPVHLVGSVIEVAVASKAPPNVQRMFKGGPATYAGVQTGASFPRPNWRPEDKAAALSTARRPGSGRENSMA